MILPVAVWLLSVPAAAQVEALLGEWRTVDDRSGEIRSMVRIYQAGDGLYCGKIEKMYKYADVVCDKCEGDNKNRPLPGLVIITGMKAEGDMLKGGTVLDPESGKTYYATLSLDRKSGKLVLRGSLDKRGLFGRNQYWIR